MTNERLEFLGDSVLGVDRDRHGLPAFPDLPRASWRSSARRSSTWRRSRTWRARSGLGDDGAAGKGEEQSGGRDKASILADALEAVFGAVYLDRGLDVAAELIERLFRPRMEAYVRGEGDRDYKTILQELASQELARDARVPRSRSAGRTTRRSSPPPCTCAGERAGRRASGDPRRKRSSRRPARRYRRDLPGAEASAVTASRGRRGVELPEVEVMRRDLEKDVVGRRIKEAEVQDHARTRCASSAGTRKRKEFRRAWRARRSRKVERKGKYLLMHLDCGDVLVVHFGMSGQFLRGTKRQRARRRTRTSCSSSSRAATCASSTRGRSARCSSRTADELGKVKELAAHRDRPAGGHVHVAGVLSTSWRAARRKLKPLLMDQKFISGLGNIYSDEVLFAAGLRYDRMSDTLSSQEVRRLYRAIREVGAGGDPVPRDDARRRGVRRPVRQAGRVRRPSSRCTGARGCRAAGAGRRSRAVKISGRNSYYCPQCQS